MDAHDHTQAFCEGQNETDEQVMALLPKRKSERGAEGSESLLYWRWKKQKVLCRGDSLRKGLCGGLVLGLLVGHGGHGSQTSAFLKDSLKDLFENEGLLWLMSSHEVWRSVDEVLMTETLEVSALCFFLATEFWYSPPRTFQFH